MINTPKHTSARVTTDAVAQIDSIQRRLKERDINVKKFHLWDEAVKLLEKHLQDEGMLNNE